MRKPHFFFFPSSFKTSLSDPTFTRSGRVYDVNGKGFSARVHIPAQSHSNASRTTVSAADGTFTISDLFQDGAAYNIHVHAGAYHYSQQFTAPPVDAVTGEAVTMDIHTQYHAGYKKPLAGASPAPA